jgi:hypothetical protein
LVDELRVAASRLEAQVGELTELLATRDVRITELEKLLEDSPRSGKRQAAPFSKPCPDQRSRRRGVP